MMHGIDETPAVRFAGKLHRKMLRNAMSMKLVDPLEAPNLCDLNADPRKAGLRGASLLPTCLQSCASES